MRSKSVLAAMSGGVDSSVAACLLVGAGYDVTGTTMKLFGDSLIGEGGTDSTCCSLDDIEDARDVCRDLGIPFYVFNFCKTFAEKVVDRFCDGYLDGRTPNPCLDCNRYLKFDALQQRRRELGLDYVATGHYARRLWDEERGRYLLLRGADTAKDQSYLLHSLTQDQLAHMLFPLGELTKPQVRAIAEEHGFAAADKPESQDICFIPNGDYPAFIERYERELRGRYGSEGTGKKVRSAEGPERPDGAQSTEGSQDLDGTRSDEGGSSGLPAAMSAEKSERTDPTARRAARMRVLGPGPIVDERGRVLGEHQGIARYTIGQRKGIGVAAAQPLYVVEKNAETNELVVGPKDALSAEGVIVHDVNLIAVERLEEPLHATVKTHYRQAPIGATIVQTASDTLEVRFDAPQPAGAPGQACVIYDGDIVVGGGTIERSLR